MKQWKLYANLSMRQILSFQTSNYWLLLSYAFGIVVQTF